MWSSWTGATQKAKEVATKATSSLQQQQRDDPTRLPSSSSNRREGSANLQKSLLDDDNPSDDFDSLTPAEIQERLAKCKVIEANFQELAKEFRFLQKKSLQIEAILKSNTPIEQFEGPNDILMLQAFIKELKSKAEINEMSDNDEISRLERQISQFQEIQQSEATAKAQIVESLQAEIQQRDHELETLRQTKVINLASDDALNKPVSHPSPPSSHDGDLRDQIRELTTTLKEVTEERNSALQKVQQLKDSLEGGDHEMDLSEMTGGPPAKLLLSTPPLSSSPTMATSEPTSVITEYQQMISVQVNRINALELELSRMRDQQISEQRLSAEERTKRNNSSPMSEFKVREQEAIFQSRLDIIQGKLEESEARKQELEVMIVSLKSDLESSRRDLDAEKIFYSQSNQQSSSELETLKAELKTSAAQNSSLLDEVRELSSQVGDKDSALSTLSSDYTNLKTKLEEEVRLVRQECDAKETQRAQLEARIQEMANLGESKELSLSVDTENRITTLMSEKEDLSLKISYLTSEKEDLKSKLSSLSCEKDDLGNKLVHLQQLHSSLEVFKTALESELTKEKFENEGMKKNSAAFKIEVESKALEQQRLVESLNRRIDEVKHQFENEHGQDTSKQIQVTSQLNEERIKSEQLTNDVSKLKCELTFVASENTRLQVRVNEIIEKSKALITLKEQEKSTLNDKLQTSLHEHSALKSRHDELECRHSEQDERIKSLEAEKIEIEAQVQATIHKMSSEMEELKRSLKLAKNQCQEMELLAGSLRGNVSTLEEEKQSIIDGSAAQLDWLKLESQSKISELEAMVKHLQSNSSEASLEADSLKQAWKQTKVQVEEFEHLVGILKGNVSALEQERRSISDNHTSLLESLKTESQSRVSDLEAQIITLQSSIATLEAERQSSSSALSAEVEGLKQSLNLANGRAEESEILASNLKCNAATLEQEKQSIIEANAAQLDELKARSQSIISELETLVRQLQSTGSEATAELESLKHALKQSTDQSAETQGNIAGLELDRQKLIEALDALKSESSTRISELEIMVNSLQASLSETRAEMEGRELSLRQAKTQVVETDRLLGILQDNVASLESMIDASTAQLNELKAQSQSKIAELEATINTIESSKSAKSLELVALKEAMKQATEEYQQEKRSLIDSHTAQFESLKTESQSRVSGLEAQITTLQSSIANLEAERQSRNLTTSAEVEELKENLVQAKNRIEECLYRLNKPNT